MKYTIEQAAQILNLAGPRHVSGYAWRKTFLNHVTLTEAQWLATNRWRRDIPQLQNETTYDRCVDACVCAQSGKIIVTVTIYNGDLVDGFPTDARCKFAGELTEMCPEVATVVEQAFGTLVEAEVERREKARIDRLRAEVEAQFSRTFNL